MRYGISLPTAGECDARAAGELARIAEGRAGTPSSSKITEQGPKSPLAKARG
jgi:hypothetical protein